MSFCLGPTGFSTQFSWSLDSIGISVGIIVIGLALDCARRARFLVIRTHDVIISVLLYSQFPSLYVASSVSGGTGAQLVDHRDYADTRP